MPITVNDIVDKLKPFSAVTFPTLGGQSKFNVIISNDGVVSIINSQNNCATLTNDFITSVEERYTELRSQNLHLAAGQYVDPNWETPNRIFSPYLARIIHFVHLGE